MILRLVLPNMKEVLMLYKNVTGMMFAYSYLCLRKLAKAHWGLP